MGDLLLQSDALWFGLKNAGSTYQRAMTTLFHDMMHREIEVYVDDMIAKSLDAESHIVNLRKFFERLRKYRLRLNPAKCVFGATSWKLLGFIVSKQGIEVDPAKIKAIVDMPAPTTQKEASDLFLFWLVSSSKAKSTRLRRLALLSK